MKDANKVAVIGLGYVGLPLAVAFSAKLPTVGFDISQQRIQELISGRDRTLEVEAETLRNSTNLIFTSELDQILEADTYIVTVPTPVDKANLPDFGPLESASRTVGTVLKPGDLVIYESTVYPGATEELCVPILEEISGLKFNQDFFVGYSPERINPGDKEHRLETIVKVVSGSTESALSKVADLYSSIISAGIHKAPSIRVAEAAKVIENTQRDLNIALMNELAKLFSKLEIDTHDVLAAAGTKWNFLRFQPGLVGGHCISVDPYYLTYKAEQVGFSPNVILAGRKTNDDMGEFVAKRLREGLEARGKSLKNARCLILGLAFKENCPDLRNSGAVKVIREIEGLGGQVIVCDPWVDAEEAMHEYDLELSSWESCLNQDFDAVVSLVAHQEFVNESDEIARLGQKALVLDVKASLPRSIVDIRI